MDSIHL